VRRREKETGGGTFEIVAGANGAGVPSQMAQLHQLPIICSANLRRSKFLKVAIIETTFRRATSTRLEEAAGYAQ